MPGGCLDRTARQWGGGQAGVVAAGGRHEFEMYSSYDLRFWVFLGLSYIVYRNAYNTPKRVN